MKCSLYGFLPAQFHTNVHICRLISHLVSWAPVVQCGSVATVFRGGQRISANYSYALFWHYQNGGVCKYELCMLVCSQKYETVYCFDIIYWIQYKINNYSCSLFDITSSLVHDNTCTFYWRSHGTDLQCSFKICEMCVNKTLASISLCWPQSRIFKQTSHNMRKIPSDMCAQQRHKFSLRFLAVRLCSPLEGSSGPWLTKTRPSNILIRLRMQVRVL